MINCFILLDSEDLSKGIPVNPGEKAAPTYRQKTTRWSFDHKEQRGNYIVYVYRDEYGKIRRVYRKAPQGRSPKKDIVYTDRGSSKAPEKFTGGSRFDPKTAYESIRPSVISTPKPISGSSSKGKEIVDSFMQESLKPIKNDESRRLLAEFDWVKVGKEDPIANIKYSWEVFKLKENDVAEMRIIKGKKFRIIFVSGIKDYSVFIDNIAEDVNLYKRNLKFPDNLFDFLEHFAIQISFLSRSPKAFEKVMSNSNMYSNDFEFLKYALEVTYFKEVTVDG